MNKRYILVENTTGHPDGLRVLAESDTIQVETKPFQDWMVLTIKAPLLSAGKERPPLIEVTPTEKRSS